MAVMVDEMPLAAEEMGLSTVGQVLAHVQRDDRLVVNLLIDGQRPDLTQMTRVRQCVVQGKTLFIETVHAQEIAFDVLDGVEKQLGSAEAFKTEAADLLQNNQVAKAMEKLAACFTTWNSARESVVKVGQLLRIDLNRLSVDGRTLAEVLAEFTSQLRQIKDALLQRDYVSLCDVLMYETSETNRRWGGVLQTLRNVVAGRASTARAAG